MPPAAAKLAAASRKDLVQAVIAGQANELAEMSPRHIRALAPVLRQARHELEAELRSWLSNAPNGEERFTAQDRRNALLAVKRAERRLRGLAEVKRTMAQVLEDQAAEAGQFAMHHLVAQVAEFSMLFEGTPHFVTLPEAAQLAEWSGALIPHYRTSAARYAGRIQKDIRRILAVGMAKNETFAQVTRRLVGHGGPRGLVALKGVIGEPGAIVEHIGEGLFRRYNYWAERIVRTEGMAAYNQLHQREMVELARQDSEYRKRWDASIDGRVCPVCRALDGEVVAVDAEFSIGVLSPPAHPYCRCVEVAWMEAWGSYSAFAEVDAAA